MKTKLLILILGVSLNSFAQDPMLFENTWHLQNLIINNEDNIPPGNNGVVSPSYIEGSEVILNFQQEKNLSATGAVCNSIGGEIEFENSNNTLSFKGMNESLGGPCPKQIHTNYEYMYFDFFRNNGINKPLNYNIITNNNNSRTLTITALNGDKAIYGSKTLSIKNNIESLFSIFYNSTNTSIKINSKNSLERFSIKIFDTLGKLVFNASKNSNKQNTIDLQSFPNGIYFVFLKTELGEILKKKIIKH